MGKQIYSNKFMLTEKYKAVSSRFSFARVHSYFVKWAKLPINQTARNTQVTVYIWWSCLPVENNVMPSFGITICLIALASLIMFCVDVISFIVCIVLSNFSEGFSLFPFFDLIILMNSIIVGSFSLPWCFDFLCFLDYLDVLLCSHISHMDIGLCCVLV